MAVEGDRMHVSGLNVPKSRAQYNRPALQVLHVDVI